MYTYLDILIITAKQFASLYVMFELLSDKRQSQMAKEQVGHTVRLDKTETSMIKQICCTQVDADWINMMSKDGGRGSEING